MSDEIILSTDPRAAIYKTDLKGWVSRNGYYFGEDERTARYEGSTHRICDGCGKAIDRNSYCHDCYRKKETEKFNAMPRKEWNGKDGLYSQAFDAYYWDMDDLEYACDDNECTVDGLMLIICEPRYASEIDPDEHYCDDLPEEGEIPDELRRAFNELNKFIRESRIVLSWVPGKYAVDTTSLTVSKPPVNNECEMRS